MSISFFILRNQQMLDFLLLSRFSPFLFEFFFLFLRLNGERPEIHLPKRKLNILVIFLNESEMFKVLFRLPINNMSHYLETKIQVVILVAKCESPVMVICELPLRGTTNISVKTCNNIKIPTIPRNRLCREP